MAATKDVTVNVELRGDKKWWQSKKFWIWMISFLGMGGGLAWSLQASSDWKVSAALVAGMTCVSMTGMLGQAFVDAVVRGVKAWKGSGEHWGESEK